MYAGIPWGQYVGFCVSAILAMFAGSQVVHNYYKPLDDLDALVQEELRVRRSAT